MSGPSALRKKRHSRLPALAQAGPVSVWMILFVTLPLLFIIYISFMTRGTFGGVVYEFSSASYETLLDATYFKVILKSFQVAVLTTVTCLLVGYPFAYYIARKPADVARLIMLLMIPMWTSSLMRLNAWMLLFQTNGPVNNALMALGLVHSPVKFIYTDGLVLLGLITNFLPFAVLPMYSSIEKLQGNLLAASADLGARPAVTFFKAADIPRDLFRHHSHLYPCAGHLYHHGYAGRRQGAVHRQHHQESVWHDPELAPGRGAECTVAAHHGPADFYLFPLCEDRRYGGALI